MKHRAGLLNRVVNVIGWSVVGLWLLGWCLKSRLGMFLLLTFLGGMTAVFLIGGTVNVIAWYWLGNFKASLADEGWFWAICFLGSTIWTLDYMLTRERKIQTPVEEDEET